MKYPIYFLVRQRRLRFTWAVVIEVQPKDWKLSVYSRALCTTAALGIQSERCSSPGQTCSHFTIMKLNRIQSTWIDLYARELFYPKCDYLLLSHSLYPTSISQQTSVISFSYSWGPTWSTTIAILPEATEVFNVPHLRTIRQQTPCLRIGNLDVWHWQQSHFSAFISPV